MCKVFKNGKLIATTTNQRSANLIVSIDKFQNEGKPNDNKYEVIPVLLN